MPGGRSSSIADLKLFEEVNRHVGCYEEGSEEFVHIRLKVFDDVTPTLVARGRKTERSLFNVHLKVREDARPMLVTWRRREKGSRLVQCPSQTVG